ncbi:sodium:proton antiporter [Latilactobacillus sakei]|uniref:cation:proton antiporter n=1 Tax=Latilactobacillus sakei TaxID=1599 RepID=UPI0020C77837|nr:sodium:proton antiporter [Latilactobacillus sakei]MCP8856009.1 sodium:proton antiporter [Latilactobacillus sakei]
MAIIEAVILLVMLLIVANIIGHYVPRLPVSLIEIGLGLLVALLFSVEIPLKTDWFMLVFVAPLLFNDGRRFPKRELWALRGPIIGNAIFLVFVTTLIGGLAIHLLVPKLPLAASFALAAILSPTDPMAVQSISEQADLPPRVLHLVSGESLINDASGLISFKYGIAAAVTGYFSIQQAAGDFLYISIVGAIAGMLLMYAIHFIRLFMLQQGIEDVVFHTVLQLITPFVIYLVVEDLLHASGVIAVVVAGIISHASRNIYLDYLPELKLVTEQTWSIGVYLLNGLVFLILGIELPVAMRGTVHSPLINTGEEILLVLAVWGILILIRTCWTLSYLLYTNKSNPKQLKDNLKISVLSGLSGVRGAITMAGVLSVPTVLADGSPFPERGLMLFIAAGVIIVSLVMAIVFIPILTKVRTPIELRGTAHEDTSDETGLVPVDDQLLSEFDAKIYMYRVAVGTVESLRHIENNRAALDLIAEYQLMMRRFENQQNEQTEGDELPPLIAEELILRQVAFEGERQKLETLWSDGEITAKTYRRGKRKLRQKQIALSVIGSNFSWRHVQLMFYRGLTMLKRLIARLKTSQKSTEALTEWRTTEKEMAKAGIKQLSYFLKQPENRQHHYNRQVIYQIIIRYRNQIENMKNIGHTKTDIYEQQLQKLRIKALTSERLAIQELLEQHKISWELADELRKDINYAENALILADTDTE